MAGAHLPRLAVVPRIDGPVPSRAVITDPEGETLAFGSLRKGTYRLRVIDAGTFEFRPDSDVVCTALDGHGTVDAVRDAFESVVLPLYFKVSGGEALHASAVSVNAGVVAFCAVSGTGKSTLASGLARRGHPLWADDAVVLSREGEGIVSRSLPFVSNLRRDSASHLGASAGDTGWPTTEPGQQLPLAHVVLLERGDQSTGMEAARLSPAAALEGLLPHAFRFDTAEPSRRQTIENYLELVEKVPVTRLRFRPGFDHFEDLLNVTEDLAAHQAPID